MRIAFVLASVLAFLQPLPLDAVAPAGASPAPAGESPTEARGGAPSAPEPKTPCVDGPAREAGTPDNNTRTTWKTGKKTDDEIDSDAGTEIDQGRQALWSLSGTDNTVYLLGSIHFLPKDEPLPGAIRAVYGRADALLMEIDMDDPSPRESRQIMLELGVLPPGQSLDRVLGPSAHATLVATARDLGLDPMLLRHLRPWLAAVTLVQANLSRKGLDSRAGIEHRLAALARRDGKPVEGLETLREQLGYLADLPESLQREFLLYSIEDGERLNRELDEMLTAWRCGDLRTLERLLAEGFEAYPELYRPLTTERNRRWIQPIEALLDDNRNHLVVVGALHLVGPDSVVELLRARGHELRRH